MRDYATLESATHEDDHRSMPPIDDLLLALLLLEHGDRVESRLMTQVLSAPYIEVRIFTSGYTRDCYTSSEYYPVTAELAKTLERYTRGRAHWGYTDEHERLISDHGYHALSLGSEGFEKETREFLAKEHPDVIWEKRRTVMPRLLTMRHRGKFIDFFVGIHINELGDEVRRTRGIFTLIRREAEFQNS